MKKFLIWLSLISLPIILFEASLELYVRSIPNNYKQKYQWMQKHCQDVEILAIGSSFMNNAICPYKFSHYTYNLSMPAQTLEYDYKILSQFIDKMTSLKFVIISADHYNLTSKPLIETKAASYRATYYQLYMNVPAYSLWSIHSYEIFNTFMLRNKIINHFSTYFKGSNYADNDSLGWKLSIGIKDKRKGWAEERYKEFLSIFKEDNDTSFIDDNIIFIDKIAEMCHKKNVNLIVVTTPKSSYFTNRFPINIMDKVVEAVTKSAENYGFIYRNYYDDSRFCDDDFITTDHLDDVGGEKFSEVLNQDFLGLN